MTTVDSPPWSPWPPPFEDALVERGRELMLQRGGVLLVGQPGSGRFELARRIGGDSRFLIHRGSLTGASTPYYALRRLDPSVEVSDRTPAQIALDLGRRRLSTDEPATVLIIGIDLCDHASLSTLIEHASTGGIHLIGTIRPAALAHHRVLASAPTIELPALDNAAISELLRQRYGGEPDPVAVEFVHARSQGAYDSVVSVTESAVELGLLAIIEQSLTLMPRPGEPPPLPPLELSAGSFRVHELLEFSPELTDLLQIVALVEEADVHELLAALPGAPLDLVLSHGVLQVDEDVVTFVIDAEAAAVAESLTLPRRAELHDRYSALFPRTFERPRAAMRAALCRQKVRGRIEPELAVIAARQANLEGLYREVIAVTVPTSREQPPPAPMERAFALVELGETAELVALLESIDPASLTEEELTDFLLLRWTHLTRDDDDRDVLVGSAESVRRRAAVVRLASLWVTSFRESSPALEAEIRALLFSGVLSALNTATGYLALSTCQRNAGRPAQAVESARTALDMLERSPTAGAYVLGPAHEILIVALLDALDFEAAEKALVQYSSRPAPHGRTARMGHALWGMLEYRRGRVELALTHSQICLDALRDNDPQGISGWVRATIAELLAQHGKFDAVEAMLSELDVHPATGRLVHDLARRTAEASGYDAVGRVEEAMTRLQGVIAEARSTGLRCAEIDAAAALAQIGGPGMLPDLKRAVTGLDDPSGTPEVWLRFVAAVEADDLTELFLLVAHLADRGAAQLAAEIARFTLDFATTCRRDLSLGERLLLQHVAYRAGS